MSKTPGVLLLLMIACGVSASWGAAPATQPATPSTQPAAAADHFDDLPPERGVVIDLDRPWMPIGWGSGPTIPMTENFGCDTSAGTARFITAPAGTLRSWMTSFVLPINAHQYPIIVARLRFKNAVTSNSFGYTWIDDGTGANGGGVSVAPVSEIDPAKPFTEFRYDGRTKANLGPVYSNFLAYVYALDKTPAEFEIVGLRFEAPPDAPAPKPSEGVPLTVTVVDEQNNPVVGATVIVDAERRNWARRGTTDRAGQATVKPLINESGRHMLRVEAAGKVPLFLPPGQFTTPQARVVMQRGQYYGGRVVDSDGKPVALARVGLFQGNVPYPRCYTLTDEHGLWRSTMMPAANIAGEIVPPNSDARITPRLYLPVNTAAFNADTPQELERLLTGGAVAPAADSNGLVTFYPVQGNVVHGKLIDITNGVLAIEPSGGGKTNVAIEDMDYISLAPEPQPVTPAITPSRGTFVIAIPTAAPPPPPPPATNPAELTWKITLADGDRLTGSLAAWTGGKLTVNGSLGNALAIPDSKITAIWCNDDGLVAQATASKPAANDQDVAFIRENDHVESVVGSVTDIEGDALVFKYENEPRRIALNRLVGVVLASADAEKEHPFAQTVRLIDGQSVSGKWTGFDPKTISLHTAWGQDVKLPLALVSSIRNRNGRLVCLSDLEPTKVEETPYFDRVIHYRRDIALAGGPLRIGDRTFEKGLAVHSRCVLTYDLGGKFVKFLTTAGFQQPDGRMGRVAVSVRGDDKILFNQSDARGDQPPAEIDVDVAGMRTLVLVVDFGEDQDVGDRFVWGNARVLRGAAKP